MATDIFTFEEGVKHLRSIRTHLNVFFELQTQEECTELLTVWDVFFWDV